MCGTSFLEPPPPVPKGKKKALSCLNKYRFYWLARGSAAEVFPPHPPSSASYLSAQFIVSSSDFTRHFSSHALVHETGNRAANGDMVVPLKKAPHVGALLGREATTANRTFGAGRVRPGSLSLWNNAGKRKPKSLSNTQLPSYALPFFLAFFLFISTHYATSTCEPPNWAVLKVLWQLFSPSPVLAFKGLARKRFHFALATGFCPISLTPIPPPPGFGRCLVTQRPWQHGHLHGTGEWSVSVDRCRWHCITTPYSLSL